MSGLPSIADVAQASREAGRRPHNASGCPLGCRYRAAPASGWECVTRATLILACRCGKFVVRPWQHFAYAQVSAATRAPGLETSARPGVPSLLPPEVAFKGERNGETMAADSHKRNEIIISRHKKPRGRRSFNCLDSRRVVWANPARPRSAGSNGRPRPPGRVDADTTPTQPPDRPMRAWRTDGVNRHDLGEISGRSHLWLGAEGACAPLNPTKRTSTRTCRHAALRNRVTPSATWHLRAGEGAVRSIRSGSHCPII